MKLTYSLGENDFWQYHLYVATKSERIKSQRTRSWLLVSSVFLLLSLLFLLNDNSDMVYLFLFLALASFIFYPFYVRMTYKNHYKKFVTENYKNRVGLPVVISFTDDAILSSDRTGESTINLSELESICETGAYFYPKLKTGGHLVIPKSGIESIPATKEFLKQICRKFSIDFIEELNWKWK